MDGFDVPLEIGELVLEVNGKPALAAVREAEQLVSASTDAHRRLRAVRTMLSGLKDSAIDMLVESVEGERRNVSVARGVPAREFREQPRPEKWKELKPGIHYVVLFRNTQAEFDELLPRLMEAKGIVFDLRGYPRVQPTTIGHLLDDTVTCAQWHLPAASLPDRRQVSFKFSNWTIEPMEPRLNAKVAFLTDERAISYAETYLGIIEHYKLGEIVGSPTAGTNGNINPFTLPGGYRVMWTGMKVLKHDGSRHHGVGIQPTVPVRPTLAGIREHRDEVLEAAVQVVSN